MLCKKKFRYSLFAKETAYANFNCCVNKRYSISDLQVAFVTIHIEPVNNTSIKYFCTLKFGYLQVTVWNVYLIWKITSQNCRYFRHRPKIVFQSLHCSTCELLDHLLGVHRLAATLYIRISPLNCNFVYGLRRVFPSFISRSLPLRRNILQYLLQRHHVSSVPDSQQVQVVRLGNVIDDVDDEEDGKHNITLVR